MRVLSFLSLVLATQACVCVEPAKVTSFKCGAESACPEGASCCADGLCRTDCAGVSIDGGRAGGAGGGSAQGGGRAGGSAAGDGGCQNDQPCTGNFGVPCRLGVTVCNGAVSSCVDGPAAPTGVSCGVGLICRAGACVTCVAGAPCASNPNPCVLGETVCGAMAGCVDTARQRVAGSPCGTGRVCTAAGTCVECDEGASCTTNPGGACVRGVIRCESGAPVCADGAPAPNGTGCGNGQICSQGSCQACVPDVACSANPGSPCRRGLTTCGATPGCMDGANAPAGTACGTSQVCDGAGGCALCSPGTPCSGNPNPCRRGVTECSTGAPVCVDDALRAAGTPCGSGQVCTATGACAACSAGGPCTGNPSAPCRVGTTSCATGSQSCIDGDVRDAGTMCGMGQVCDGNGFCGACVAGTPCTSNPGAPCRSGVIDCSTGSTRCVDSMPLSPGTPCGPDQVCTAAGSCASCIATVTCTTNPSPGCKVGTTSCASGVQTCVDASNRPAGTACGLNQVCSATGSCVACVANMACVTNPSACRNGITDCSTGASRCVDGSNKMAGTSCGTNQTCDANGNCGACVPNVACTTNPGAPCKLGKTDCSTGATRCLDDVNAMAGTSCGAGQVCNAAGACLSCTSGNTCSTNPDPCRNGVTDCSTGASRCVDGSNKVAGSTCGTNQVCNAAAMCVNCSAGATCTPTNPCFNGSISCTSGSPLCTNGSRKGTGASCGTNQVCNASDQCVSCTQGASCPSNPNAACRNGTVECGSGAAVCQDGSAKTNGTACAGGVCLNGTCNPCTGGGTCTTNPGAACRTGVLSCASGMQECVDSGNKPNGTACSGGACLNGSCNPCVAGQACTTNPGSACRSGITSCASGSSQCVDDTPKTNGTMCPGGVCNGGTCSACTQGSGCTPTNPCKTGSVECGTGVAVCTDSGNRTNGTVCPGGVCLNGTCNPCSQGSGCSPANPCKTGSVDCSSGAGQCNESGNRTNGTACPGGVCLNGACNPCSQGAGCSPANPCKTGSIECSSGSGVCTESGNQGAGTACPGGVCNGSGSCVACTQGATCTPANPCRTGTIECGSGAPVCTESGNVANLTACPGGRCATGVCCTGCINTSNVCQPGGFNTLACGLGGVNCRRCTCAPGWFPFCDTGVCTCEI